MNKRILLLTATLTTLACPVRAGFILDDFDDSASTTIQTGLQPLPVTTESVGALEAKRDLLMIARRGNPVGSLDADTSEDSALSSFVTDLNPGPTNDPDVFVLWDYEFAAKDFSEEGRNKAFFFDFHHLTSKVAPSQLLLVLTDTDFRVYVYQEFSIPLSSGPFTVIAPFSGFATRGGFPWDSGSTRITSVSIELRPTLFGGGGPDPLNFHMELERIRVDEIPEPSAFVLVAFAYCMAMGKRLRGFQL